MQKKNAHLQETLAKMEKEHQLAITKMQQTHDERIAKMREHYVDFTHSILTLKDSTPGSSSGNNSSTSSTGSSSNSSGGGAGSNANSGASSGGSSTSKSKYVDRQYCLASFPAFQYYILHANSMQNTKKKNRKWAWL